MPTETTKAPAAAPPATVTLNTFLADAVRLRGDRTALRRKLAPGKWEDVSWRSYRAAVREVGLGLIKLGLGPGDRAAILSNSRVEWCYADLGVLGAGGVAVPIYQNVREDEVAYIVQDSGARFIFLEDAEQVKKLGKARLHPEHGDTRSIEKAIAFDPAAVAAAKGAGLPDGFVISLDDLRAIGAKEAEAPFEERSAAARRDDLITLVYTSGTTGKPKGVMLTHGNAAAEAEALDAALGFRDEDVVLSFLPLAHIFARACHWGALKCGYACAYTSIADALADMKDVRPTALPSVPRFFEKVHAAVVQKVESEGRLKRAYVRRALAWQIEADRCLREGRPLSLGLSIKAAIAKPAVKKISAGLREKTGGRLRIFISGGAPLSKAIAEFFHALGFLILEGYGLTETTAGSHVNRIGRYKLGTVGPAVPGLEMELAPDGEILVRGAIVMKGYFNKPEATKEVLDDRGFLRTGDIGEVDSDGFLRITDRKKDLIKTSGGKYVAPQNVENLMKTIPGVSQFAVFGDQRKYCTALVCVDLEAARRILREAGVAAPEDPKALATHEVVQRAIERGIAERNATLGSYETVKYFRVVPKDFEVGDELTPTLKVKRKHVAEKYKALIEEMYVEKGGE